MAVINASLAVHNSNWPQSDAYVCTDFSMLSVTASSVLASIRGPKAASKPHQLELMSWQCNSFSSSFGGSVVVTIGSCSSGGRCGIIVMWSDLIISNKQPYATDIPYPSGIVGIY